MTSKNMNLFFIIVTSAVVAFHCIHPVLAQSFDRSWGWCKNRKDQCGLGLTKPHRTVAHLDYQTGICSEKCVGKSEYRVLKEDGWNCGTCGPTFPLTEVCNNNDASYDICMKLKVNPSDVSLFVDAAKLWTGVIKNDLPPVQVNGSGLLQLPCGSYPETIDDLYLCEFSIEIDGVDGILGGGFTYYVRDTEPFLAYVGGIVLDYEDMDQLRDDATLVSLAFDVIRHEVGHVIGIGTTWYDRNVAEGNFTDPQCNYTGVKTNTLYKNWTGCDGNPLHHEDGEGSMCGHWDEFCLQEELFTALSNDTNLLSALSIVSLEDIGYTVDYSPAENYTKNNVNPACFCNTARRMQEDVAVDHFRITEEYIDWKNQRNSRHRSLSEEGRNKAIVYSRQLLKENAVNINPVSARSFAMNNGLLYVW